MQAAAAMALCSTCRYVGADLMLQWLTSLAVKAIEAAGVEEPRDEQPVGMYNGGLMELARKYR
jgi:hypothetical protein